MCSLKYNQFSENNSSLLDLKACPFQTTAIRICVTSAHWYAWRLQFQSSKTQLLASPSISMQGEAIRREEIQTPERPCPRFTFVLVWLDLLASDLQVNIMVIHRNLTQNVLFTKLEDFFMISFISCFVDFFGVCALYFLLFFLSEDFYFVAILFRSLSYSCTVTLQANTLND